MAERTRSSHRFHRDSPVSRSIFRQGASLLALSAGSLPGPRGLRYLGRVARHSSRPLSGLLWLLSFALVDGGGPGSVRAAPTQSPLLQATARDKSPTERSERSVTLRDERGRLRPSTVDPALQRSARMLLAEARPLAGAAVVVEVSTGRVLAFAEWPTPTALDQSLLYTRQLPSASLFKLVTTAALLERAKIPANRTVCTQGGEHRLEQSHLERPTRGLAFCGPFSEILAQSRNAAFAQLVHRFLEPDDLFAYADRLGFDAPLPFDLPVQLGHFEPPRNDDPLLLARTATGFVGSTLSVTGAAYLAFMLANGGLWRPIRVFSDTEPRLGVGTAERILDASTVTRLRRMMLSVTERGTAADAFHDPKGRRILANARVAGKTGTLGSARSTTSWFLGFAPATAPKVALAVALENGEPYHRYAKQLARELFCELLPNPNS